MTKPSGTPLPKATQSNGAAVSPAKDVPEREKREARIAELRKEFLAGSYRPNACDIARKLVDAHLDK